MSNPFPRDRLMTVDEYFAFEEASSERHEYVDGQVLAMSGVTRQHSRITGNVFARLWAAARGGPCRVHQSEVKLRIGSIIYYPDVMVACGSPPRDPRVEDAPVSLFEVLSPSTERVDLGEKAMVYTRIRSLETYVVVDQERRWVERRYRDTRGHWEAELLTEGGVVPVPPLGVVLTLDEIYEGVELPSREEWLRRLRLREEALSWGVAPE